MTSLQRADNWFWVLNLTEDGYGVEIERVVAWTQGREGWEGLLSPELSGGTLQGPPPFKGGIYKHLNDLTPLERQALDCKRRDKEPNPYRHWATAGVIESSAENTQQNR